VAEAVRAAMPKVGVPGAVLGILADGKEEYAAFGVESIETKQPVSLDTRFQIGSTTKTYTGTAIMRLVEQGKIGLEAPIRTYLPDFMVMDADASAKVTIKDCLTHAGGWWGDLITDTGSGDDAIAVFMQTKMPTFPQLAPVGQYFSYNNTGFITLGRVMEVLLGTTYRALMQNLVLGPLGLAATTLVPEEARAAPHATAHAWASDPRAVQIQQPQDIPRNADPAGGIWSTVRDMIAYARFHMGDGTANGQRILSAETLRQMQTPQGPKPPSIANNDVGLPWLQQTTAGLHFLAEPGDTFGMRSEFVLIPDRGFAFSLLANSQPGGALLGSAAQNVAAMQYLGIGGQPATPPPGAPTATAAQSALTKTITVPPDKLAQYAGRYTVPTETIVLRVEGDGLTATGEPGTRQDQIKTAVHTSTEETPQAGTMVFIAPDIGLVTGANNSAGAVPVIFVRKPGGDIGWLSLNLTLVPRVSA
jgi:CubicO group peptidase (beta-lactamase class C family)